MKKLYFIILCAAAILFAGCEKEKQNPLLEKVYLKGYTVYGVPYNGTAYKISFIGTKQSFIHTEPFGSETDWTNDLYNSQLPRQFILINPAYICERIDMMDYEYFTCAVKYYSGSAPGGTKCMSERHYLNEQTFISNRPTEIIFTATDGKTKVGVLFEYR